VGKRIARRRYKLSFQPGTDLEGLTVVLRGLSLGEVISLRAEGARSVEGDGEAEPEIVRMAKLIADQLVEWDAEDEDGTPIPATLDGLLSQDKTVTLDIFEAWQEAVTGVPAPLEQPSSDGQTSLEASIPMEIPSESLAS
jgi:hypothetical protein